MTEPTTPFTDEQIKALRAGITQGKWQTKFASYTPPDHDGYTAVLRANSAFIAAAPALVDQLLQERDEARAELKSQCAISGRAHDEVNQQVHDLSVLRSQLAAVRQENAELKHQCDGLQEMLDNIHAAALETTNYDH